ncbi:synaptonemal complex central element protein 2 [Elysia marginata]|uniref:Synaptonemal complex central element protein 2 n=1 Tax=Elysia marginata TaxID=1093978 RepID=A0AAV4EVH4_9GAST|nr:synaptonemal complex central element protein 2 [Elysia marginata]
MDSESSGSNKDDRNKDSYEAGSNTALAMDGDGQEEEQYQMSLEDIEASMKQMIEDVGHKRENDLAILEEVKKEIMAQAKRSCEILDQHMADMHAAKGKEIDEKWEELVKVLDRIKESEAEIEKTRSSLSLLCKADTEQ